MSATTMRWFGKSWGAPVCDPDDHWPSLPDKPCGYCKKPFVEGDAGLLLPHLGGVDWVEYMGLHRDCLLAWLGIGRDKAPPPAW